LTFNITILGTNAALPVRDSITSAQIVNVHDQLYVVDCGEGMQSKLQKYRIKRNRIQAVFISHLHGDHVFGLPGLLTSYAHKKIYKNNLCEIKNKITFASLLKKGTLKEIW
jgi:ribonuclease BN (tRNA processing enzyme)